MPVNRLLNEGDRIIYKPLLENMNRVIPNLIARKIPRSMVQQAFVLDTVRKWTTYKCKILSVGCFEDTAFEYMKLDGQDIIGIDPSINFDLHSYRNDKTVVNFRYDIIFSTSVIEHVENDEEFLDDICKLLKESGIGILTMDFNNDYRPGDKLPYSDLRFYTKKDLEFRLTKILTDNGCDLVDIPDWSGEPEFTHDGCTYSFSTFVFRKIGNV